ncbi:hypothetical protein QWY84_00570 [Aquisalimonas lutea]|uniref:hypothetical protein n=1 Tax=Aquisalimonas lutea TaxID=1327750 RepID=UPI0025B4949B|nr:hypothetical protein [Aquisalimonas lutea]MDN3516090.1 hypothetical protein [Aquisalimonas lutea]
MVVSGLHAMKTGAAIPASLKAVNCLEICACGQGDAAGAGAGRDGLAAMTIP